MNDQPAGRLSDPASWSRPAAAALFALAACGGGERPLIVASTSSLYDSGLLDVLVPAFEAAHPGIDVRVAAVGTGEALEMGRRGDADVLLVHAPEAERAFVAAGYGVGRTPFLRNDFVIIGPAADPAGVRNVSNAPEAFAAIAAAGTPFLSRGDDSGTHRRERRIWETARIDPGAGIRASAHPAPGSRGRAASDEAAEWYHEVGQGMGATLLIAGERQAYTLTDRATFTGMRDVVPLDILFPGPAAAGTSRIKSDSLLRNVYSIIEVAGAANMEGADVFSRWLTTEATPLIREFGGGTGGRQLFRPTSDPTSSAKIRHKDEGGDAGSPLQARVIFTWNSRSARERC